MVMKKAKVPEKFTLEMFQEIDFKPLFKKIAKTLNSPNIQPCSFNTGFDDSREKIIVGSAELVGMIGIMACTLKSVKIQNFGGSFRISKAGKAIYYLPIYLGYEHKPSGSNCSEVLTAWYRFEEKKWSFQLAGGLIEGEGS